MKQAKTEKIFFLGVDGMDPDTTRRLVDEGKMPNVKKLIERGACRENLHMLGGVPTITPPMWTTLATGCSPNVHGITCYWNQSHERLDELVYAFHSDLCKAETLWETTAKEGLKTLVWHWPSASWPPKLDSDNLHVVDGTTPGCVNMGVCVVEAEKIITASNDIKDIKFKAKVAIDNGAGCVIHDVEHLDTHAQSLSEKSTAGTNMVNYEMSFSDGEGSFEEMQMDMYNSPLSAPHGWSIEVPEDAIEFVAGANKGLERRYGLILKNAEGKYGIVRVYRNKKSEEPLVELTPEDYIKFNVVDEYETDKGHKTGAGFWALMELEEDGSFVRLYVGPSLDIYGDSHFQPKSLYQDVTSRFGYINSPTFTGGQYPDVTEKIILPTWKNFMDWQANCLNYLMEEGGYKVVFSHMHNIDAMGHQFWHWCEKRKRNQDINPDDYIGYVEKCYLDTDDYIGQFLHLLDEGWTIFLFSDHGFMTTREEEPPVLGDPFGVNVPILQKLGYTVLKDQNETDSSKVEIDWSKTTAVAPRGNYIYINLKGKYETGIVDPADKYDLEEQIINDLYNYRDPESGKRVVYLCMRNKEAELVGMSGPECGDIIYWINEGMNRGHGDSLPTFNGLNGTCVSPIFIAAGPGIKEGVYTERRIREMDVAPTAAALLGIRMPANAEGAPVYQIIED